MSRAIDVLGLVAAALAAKNLLTSHGDLGIYLDIARELRVGGLDLCPARGHGGHRGARRRVRAGSACVVFLDCRYETSMQ